jgi:hypothetical protein
LKGQSHVVRGVAVRVFCFQFCDIKNLVKFCTQKKKKLVKHTNEKNKSKLLPIFFEKIQNNFPQEKIMVNNNSNNYFIFIKEN